jgi:hypothetical protein
MPIIVVCPGCRKSFKVSKRFAGKSGACPRCKHRLRVPTLAEQVRVGAGDEARGGNHRARNRRAIKPIARTELVLKPVAVAALVAICLSTLAITWAGGKAGMFQNRLLDLCGLLLLSPPLVVAAYAFLRDDEREPYRGRALYLRAGLCALAYTALWGVIVYFDSRNILSGELYTWIFVASPVLVIGALAALASLDLDFGSSILHYASYLLVTIVLRWLAGIAWTWQVVKPR